MEESRYRRQIQLVLQESHKKFVTQQAAYNESLSLLEVERKRQMERSKDLHRNWKEDRQKKIIAQCRTDEQSLHQNQSPPVPPPQALTPTNPNPTISKEEPSLHFHLKTQDARTTHPKRNIIRQ
jgi:hypothetical protein